ncbi:MULTISPECIES: hypothetical protein [Pantoea]|uniref:hypothetical protein n=1 Tax=Pantoea TaxID=53335 RepID=UPI001313F4E0|nr:MULTISPECIES: hypothetical protein [Pantoea]
MKPLDHYRLSMYLHTRNLLQQRLDEVNAKIERVQYQPPRRLPLSQRILNWWLA